MRHLLVFILCLLSATAWADGAVSQQDITRATLVSRTAAIVPGQALELGVLLEPKSGWHSYWENPGDAGLATSLDWTLPEHFAAGGIDWPVPARVAEGPLVTYSYDGNVFLPVVIAVPKSLDKARQYPLRVMASWLVCNTICVPESAQLELRLPVSDGPAPPSADAWLFEEHDRHRPVVIADPVPYHIDDGKIILPVPLAALNIRHADAASFFPRQPNVIRYAGRQSLQLDNGMLRLAMDKADGMPDGAVSGLLTVTTDGGERKAYDIHLAAVPAAETAPWLPALLLLAMLGGIVLNLMPCVLPVLSLKALALVGKAGAAPRTVIRQGIAYTLGILASFAVIAGILILLQQGGEAVGWGYQMQSSAFIGFLAYLLFLVGLSLSGVFHLPVLLGQLGHNIADESSARGSFFTGVLAAAVATPCTAPFMASAVGVALTLPPLQAMLVFEALGLGLALPFLLISLCPPLRRFLPRPGAWMETFKKLLALPMYASVAWLLWVLALQTGTGGLVVVLAGMLMLLAILRMAYRPLALGLCGLLLALSLPALDRMEAAQADIPGDASGRIVEAMGVTPVAFSPATLAAYRAAGKAVFIDATAAWCITCQLNARTSILTQATMEAFKTHGVTLMIADWTRRNDEITAFLSGFGYRGVPLYVFYPAGNRPPVVLPQLLTEDTVVNTVSQ